MPSKPLHSPDGRIEVRIHAYDPHHSLWVYTPEIVRTRDGKIVATFDRDWDCGRKAEFPEPDVVRMLMRKFPRGGHQVHVAVDVEAETYSVGRGVPPHLPIVKGRIEP